MVRTKRKANRSMSGSKRRRTTPYTRKRYRYGVKGRGSIAKLVKRTIFRMAEPKYKLFSHGKTELYHNGGTGSFSSWLLNGSNQMPSQGTGDDQRNGDRINMSGFQLKMLCGHKFDRPNITWRILVVSIAKNSAQNSLFTYNTVFENVSGNAMLDSVNTDNVTILYQKFWKPQRSTLFADASGNTDAATKEYTFTKKIWIPRKMEYKFVGNGSTTHQDRDIYFIAIPYDAYGSLNTDNIAYLQLWQKTAYRDP